MARSKEKQNDVWFDKLADAHEAASKIRDKQRDADIGLAVELLLFAQMYAEFFDKDNDLIALDAPIEKPKCLHCGNDTSHRRWPMFYCSNECKDIVGAARSGRRVVAMGRRVTLDLLVGFGQKAFPWITSGKAYSRYVPASVKRAVMERDGQKCVHCSAPAEHIDHIVGSSVEMSNLQALCAECNRRKMLDGLVPLTDEDKKRERAERRAYLARLIANPVPPSACFDEAVWKEKWRDFGRLRAKNERERTNADLYERIRKLK